LKNKRRLRSQILLLVMLFFIIGTVIGTIAMYYSSRNTYLKAKNDMIERDLKVVSDYFDFPEAMSWFFDYSKLHSKEISAIQLDSDHGQIFDMYSKASKSGTPVKEI
jgi:hypothetical protein